MLLERDDADERLARIGVLFDEANRTKATMAPTDRPLRRQLVVQLDQMLTEWADTTFNARDSSD